MKLKLELSQSEEGWMVMSAEYGCGRMLVDKLPTKADAQACMERLNDYTDQLRQRWGIRLGSRPTTSVRH